MSDYTPTTDEVLEYYVEGRWESGHTYEDEEVDGFTRWLAAHDAEVRADAERERAELVAGFLQQKTKATEAIESLLQAEHHRVAEAREAGRREGLAQAADLADSHGHHWSGKPAQAFFKLAEQIRGGDDGER